MKTRLLIAAALTASLAACATQSPGYGYSTPPPSNSAYYPSSQPQRCYDCGQIVRIESVYGARDVMNELRVQRDESQSSQSGFGSQDSQSTQASQAGRGSTQSQSQSSTSTSTRTPGATSPSEQSPKH